MIKMRSLILWVAVFAMVAFVAAEEKKIVCYFGSWSTYRPNSGKFVVEDIDANLCTHLMYAFTGVFDDEIRIIDPWQDLPDGYGLNGFARFIKLKEKNRHVKTMVAIGGWNEGSIVFSDMASSRSTRAIFIQSILRFLDEYKFDGLDIDWEYPAQRYGDPDDKDNFSALVKELKDAFAGTNYILSAAVAGPRSSASQSYNIPEISKHLDFINLLTYDFHGSWENRTGHVSPLYHGPEDFGLDKEWTVDASVQYWLSEGAPREKLVLGIPFYGRSFTLKNPRNNTIGAEAVGPGIPGPYTREEGNMGYNEICEKQAKHPWTVVFDTARRVPYTYRRSQWIGYENVQSVREKAEYVLEKDLGGAMMWSIETDDFRSKCGPRYPLLNTLNDVLANK